MKKIYLFAVVGLMSLLGTSLLSSCEDRTKFVEEEEFAPYGYYVMNATSIKVVGYKGLIIEEIEKNDWQLYVQYTLPFIGNEPLKLDEYEFRILQEGKNTVQIDATTNMDPIGKEEQDVSIAVGGLLLNYTYLGQQRKLICLNPLKVVVKVNIEEKKDTPYFFEKGKIDISLMTNDTVSIIQKSVPYTVAPTEYYREQSEAEENPEPGSDSES